MSKTVILFPGQGSQFIGMGKKLLHVPIVKRMFEIANSVFKKDLLNLCINGPENELNKTINCQAVVYVTSLAAVEKLKLEEPSIVENCIATAGFSVGEYASLVLSGAITYEDGLALLKERAEIMQKQSEAVSSGLMSVFINHDSELKKALFASKEWCEKSLKLEPPIVCSIANKLFPDCKVIGGNTEALDFIEMNYKEFKIRNVKRLPVSGAFHTQLMKAPLKYIKNFTNLLEEIKINDPLIPTYSNVTGRAYKNRKEIPNLLIDQIYKPVLWEQIMHIIYEKPKDTDFNEFPMTYECGPGKQLGTILRQINSKAHKFYNNVNV